MSNRNRFSNIGNKIQMHDERPRTTSIHQHKLSSSDANTVYFKIKSKLYIKNENIAEYNLKNSKNNTSKSASSITSIVNDNKRDNINNNNISRDLNSLSLLSLSASNNNNSISSSKASNLNCLDETLNSLSANKINEELNENSILNFSSYGSLLAYEFANKKYNNNNNNAINSKNIIKNPTKMLSSNHSINTASSSSSTIKLDMNKANFSSNSIGDTFIKLYNNNDLKYPFVLKHLNSSSNSGQLATNLSARSRKSTADVKLDVNKNSANNGNFDSIYLKRREMTNLTSISNLRKNDIDDLSSNLSSIENNMNVENKLTSTSEIKTFKKPEYNAYVQKLKEKNVSTNNAFFNNNQLLRTNFSNNLTETASKISNKSKIENNEKYQHDLSKKYLEQKSKSSLAIYDSSSLNNSHNNNNIIYLKEITDAIPNTPPSANASEIYDSTNYEFSKTLLDRIRARELSSRNNMNLNILLKGLKDDTGNLNNNQDLDKSLDKSSYHETKTEQKNQNESINIDAKSIDLNDITKNSGETINSANSINIKNDQVIPKRVTSALINRNHFFRTDSGMEVNKFTKQQYESSKAYYVNGKNVNNDLAKMAIKRKEKIELNLSNKIIHFLPKFTKSLSKLNKASEKNLEKRYLNEMLVESLSANNSLTSNNNNNISNNSFNNNSNKEFKYNRERSLLNFSYRKTSESHELTVKSNENSKPVNSINNDLLKISKLAEHDHVLDKVSSKELQLIDQKFFNNNNNNENNTKQNSDEIKISKKNENNIILVKESSSISNSAFSNASNMQKTKDAEEDDNFKISKTTKIFEYKDPNELVSNEKLSVNTSSTKTSNRSLTLQQQNNQNTTQFNNCDENRSENNVNQLTNNYSKQESEIQLPPSSASSAIIRISKKRVSFHESVIEMDFDSGNSITKPININELL